MLLSITQIIYLFIAVGVNSSAMFQDKDRTTAIIVISKLSHILLTCKSSFALLTSTGPICMKV